ncbi:MAG: hypothetical protein ACXVIQ_14625 [Ilumatobacteraceae bacterium]
MNCRCNDGSHETGTALWHRAYCNWYDADRAGRKIRAAVWGFVADHLVTFA